MRYHIDTIPVWDAMKLDGECLLCALERRTELGEAERYLGASVMEPDVRIRVNSKGFCRKHHAMLFSMSNRLGHALMLESHMIEIRERMEKISGALGKSAAQLKDAGLGDRLSGKTKNAAGEILKQEQAIEELGCSCLMCELVRGRWLGAVRTAVCVRGAMGALDRTQASRRKGEEVGVVL